MKYLFFICGIFLSCISCDKMISRYSSSYVLSYYDFQDIKLEDKSKHPEYLIKVDLISGSNLGSVLSKGQQKEAFDRLCEKHGDTGYNREVRFMKKAILCDYIDDNIISVMVTSDSAYDEHHPANTDLGDVIEFLAVSPLKYIRSGYKDLYDWNNCPLTEYEKSLYEIGYLSRELHLTKTNLSEVKKSNLELIGNGLLYPAFYLKLLKMPYLSKEHTFTVTITIEDGRVFSDNVTISFLNADE